MLYLDATRILARTWFKERPRRPEQEAAYERGAKGCEQGVTLFQQDKLAEPFFGSRCLFVGLFCDSLEGRYRVTGSSSGEVLRPCLYQHERQWVGELPCLWHC